MKHLPFLTRVLLKKVCSLLLVAIIVIAVFMARQKPPAAHAASLPYVQGTQLIDATGHPFLLRGAVIESSFIYANSWKTTGNPVSSKLNPTVFNQMSAIWHMNALRLPISNWIYASDPTHYLKILDQVIQQANQAGLYVILDLHDDQQSGSPYGSGAQVPKPESAAFWQTIAAHYLANGMVMFDAYNEPQYPNANTWLNGGGTITGSTGLSAPIVGMQALVNAIRGTGAQQIIVIGGISVAGNLRINDPNIVYTRHVYHDVATGDPTIWNALWGSFLGNYPLYYGEWALLPNGSSYQCQSATPANADQKVIDFMNYMEQNNISWTAWQFDSPFLIQDHTTYAPTKLDDPNNPWICGSSTISTAGMGTVVYLHLQSLAMSGGSLTASGDFSGASGSVALNGQDQYITYIVPIMASDTRSSGAGWHLTITSTLFSIVGSPSIKLSSDAPSIDGVTASCSGNGICTTLNNGITYPLLLPAGDGVPAVSFFQANPYSGIGTFTVTAKMGVLIPADAYAGVYTSSITLSMVNGP